MLKDGAAALGVGLGDAELSAFELYLAELVKWNKVTNLTAVDIPGDVVIKHFLDSIALAPLLPEGPFRAVDVGAGAGFPGLPLKIVRPDMELTLVEPARKKAAFLKQAARALGLSGVDVLEEKVEAVAGPCGGGFDVLLSRAFREPAGLLAVAGALVAPGGAAVLSLGPGASPAAPVGWRVVAEREITLPFSDYRRRLVRLAAA